VTTVVTGDDVPHSKPAPDCYLLALQRLGLPASQCLAVEDTQHGVAAATAAGLRCLAVPNALSTHHRFDQAHAVLNGWAEVESYFDSK
jgi:beta-phosphoglucomutase-like phosphatase (HAD superfamily)